MDSAAPRTYVPLLGPHRHEEIGGEPQAIARVTGILFVLTFIASIFGLLLYGYLRDGMLEG